MPVRFKNESMPENVPVKAPGFPFPVIARLVRDEVDPVEEAPESDGELIGGTVT